MESLSTGPSAPTRDQPLDKGMIPSPQAGLTPTLSPGPSSAPPLVGQLQPHQQFPEFQAQLEGFQAAMQLQLNAFAGRLASQITDQRSLDLRPLAPTPEALIPL